jgi:hypothetical protein
MKRLTIIITRAKSSMSRSGMSFSICSTTVPLAFLSRFSFSTAGPFLISQML